jgi:hypothetical protein
MKIDDCCFGNLGIGTVFYYVGKWMKTSPVEALDMEGGHLRHHFQPAQIVMVVSEDEFDD